MKVLQKLLGLPRPQSSSTPEHLPEGSQPNSSEVARNVICALLVLFSTAVELGMREAFYSVSSEAPGLLLVMLLTGLVLAVAIGGIRTSHASASRLTVSRITVLMAAMAWWRLSGVGLQLLPSMWAWPLLGLAGLMGLRLNAASWAVVCRTLAAAIAIFVLSQPLLAHLRARDLQWPPVRQAGMPAADQPAPVTTVVVLLDELSAGAAGPIAEAMGRSGYPVVRRAIDPSGDATGKVVPSMFAGRPFKESKPCSWHTVCSGADVLDMDRVQASRPDIDVVGFYFPYCAVRGLRSCEVVAPESPYLDWARWRCAAQRRSEWLTQFDGEDKRLRCAQQNGRIWIALGEAVESAIWNAPVWTQGGVLYAHVPLPHPPGEGGAASLEQHYRVNIEKAAQLVGKMAERLASTQRPFSLVVFSDHPLRPYWCLSLQYRPSCPPSTDLLDDKVPLLATGVVDPAFARVNSNMDIFQLIAVQRR